MACRRWRAYSLSDRTDPSAALNPLGSDTSHVECAPARPSIVQTNAMRVLIVDDHEVVRRGIRSILATQPTLQVCGEAVDGRDAVNKALALQPDIVVMDITMPEMNGLDAAREIKRVLPQAEVIIVSQHDAPELIRQAYEAGARGYVVKTAVSTDLLAAIGKTNGQEGMPTRETTEAASGSAKNKNSASAAVEKDLQELARSLERRVSEQTAELDEARNELRDVSARLFRAQDEERRRIARELHDGVGQLLAAINMSLSAVSDEPGKLSAEAARSVHQSLSLVEQASRDIRTMSHLLHPPLLDEVGLESALRAYVDGFAERSKIDVTLDLEPVLETLPRELDLSLFRIVQECLTNIHRHSGSQVARVRLYRTSGDVRLEIADRGRGIPAELLEKLSSGEGGVGLRGIRERLRRFGGRLELRSDETGAVVTAIFPHRPEIAHAEADEGDLERPSQSFHGAEEPKRERGAASVLCVDDEKSALLSRKLLLESAGHRVIEARSGKEGIRLFQTEKLDLVILDYWMSDMKGTAVAAEMKRLNPLVPIVMLSGLPELPGETMGMVDQWLMKGSRRAEYLLDAIETLLDRRPI